MVGGVHQMILGVVSMVVAVVVVAAVVMVVVVGHLGDQSFVF
jgi:ABC-type transporter Mla subunit MlaD